MSKKFLVIINKAYRFVKVLTPRVNYLYKLRLLSNHISRNSFKCLSKEYQNPT